MIICDGCKREMTYVSFEVNSTEEERKTLAPYEYCDCGFEVYQCSGCNEKEYVLVYECDTCERERARDAAYNYED